MVEFERFLQVMLTSDIPHKQEACSARPARRSPSVTGGRDLEAGRPE
jgi:hypothetical protein